MSTELSKFSLNISTVYITSSVSLIKMYCRIFFRLHSMLFYGVETWYMRLYKKDLKNVAVPYHKVFKRICGRNSYDSNHECLEQVNLSIFQDLFVKKQIQFTFRLFHSRSLCLSSYKYCFRYGSLFCK